MRAFVEDIAGHLGYEITPKWRRPRLPMATKLKSIFAYFDIGMVIDVGANEGQYGDFLRAEVGYKGAIVSYEPVPEFAERLKIHTAADPLWSVRPYALGATSGELVINVMAGTFYSSFRNPLKSGMAVHDKQNSVARTALVPVHTLDTETFGNSSLERTYLKLDTQGFDLEVLKGGPRTVSAIPAMQSEISFRAIYEGMPDYKEAFATFHAHGFSVSDMFLVSSDGQQRAVEFDCIMVK